MSTIRTRLAIFFAAIIVGAGLGVPSAEALTVPNVWYCSRTTGLCRQINGPHNSTVKDECRWVWNTYWTGTSTRVCDYWR
ncbi:hypothetical protein [Humibacillus xanthopallidus]|uniref:hypothetical protein n=1 Tax=Humibacillus xanthopallidus TaxID=412689 RepID=UPI00384C9E6E